MNDIRNWLQDADPARSEAGLSAHAMDAMLRQVRADIETRHPAKRAPTFTRLAAGIALAICTLGGVATIGFREWNTQELRREALAPVRPEPVRQLYFSTPDGTRVIWIFNPSFPE
jgi:hypothetical protein